MTTFCCILLWIFIKSTSSSAISARAHADYISLRWETQDNASNHTSSYKIIYQISGTKFHSAFTVDSAYANITTTEYPGMLFLIQLYEVTGAKLTHIASKYIRAACFHSEFLDIGEKIDVTSPMYPNLSYPLTMCQWSYKSNKDSWFKIDILTFSLPGDNCSSYVNISGKQICESTRKTFIQSQNEIDIIYNVRSRGGILELIIEAIPVLGSPCNITAESNGEGIWINWHYDFDVSNDSETVIIFNAEPAYEGSKSAVIASNITDFYLNSSMFRGQVIKIQLHTRNAFWESSLTTPVYIRAACFEDFYVPKEGYLNISSMDVRPGIQCINNVYTDDDFYLKMWLIYVNVTTHGGLCNESFIRIPGIGQFCHVTTTSRDPFVVPASSTDITYETGSELRHGGYSIRIKSVPKPCGSPRNVRLTVTTDDIIVKWNPPQMRQQYLIGYYLSYDVIPDVSDRTLKTDGIVTELSIPISEYRGRLLGIKVAALTEGGRGNFSNERYARTECGISRHLQHGESLVVISPTDVHGKYPPNVVCKWSVITNSFTWIKLSISMLSVQNTLGCESDYLEVNSYDRKCGFRSPEELLFKEHSLNLTFVSDNHDQFTGFVAVVKAVAPPPGRPIHFRVTPSEYGLVTSWNQPPADANRVVGYTVYFRLNHNVNPSILKSQPWDRTSFINTRANPGQMFELWIQSEGESGHGEESDHVNVRSRCGGLVEYRNKTLFLSSPKYPDVEKTDTECRWIFPSNGQRLIFNVVDLNFPLDSRNTCLSGYVTLCEHSKICDMEKALMTHILLEPNCEIYYKGSTGSNFLISVNHYDEKRISVSGSDTSTPENEHITYNMVNEANRIMSNNYSMFVLQFIQAIIFSFPVIIY